MERLEWRVLERGALSGILTLRDTEEGGGQRY